MEYDEEQKSVLLVTITQLTQSDSGPYRCKLEGTGSSSYRDFHVTVRTASMSAAVPMFVGLTLIIIIIILLLSLALLVYCTNRSHQHHKAPLVQTESSPVTESTGIYEVIREDEDQWRSVDVEIYSSYSNRTASQNKPEDDSTKVTSAEVKFSNRKLPSPLRTSCGTLTDPQKDGSSHEEPLYSTIT